MTEIPKESYPLTWPSGQPRTRYPSMGRFESRGFGLIRDEVLDELRRFGAIWLDIMLEVLAGERDGDCFIAARKGCGCWALMCGHCGAWDLPPHVALFRHQPSCQVLRARATVELARRRPRGQA